MTDATRETLREELENAPEVPNDQAGGGDPRADDARGDDREGADRGANGGGRRDKRGRPRGQIWDGCPVTPLGVYGKTSFYLDVRGQLIDVSKHDLDTIRLIFGGRVALLARHFPQFDKDGNTRPGKFDQADAASAMCQACDECGVWSPARSLRGPGCWTDDDGRLIYHAGDAILIGGEWHPPGRYDGKTYGAFEPIPRPAPHQPRENPASELLPMLQSWAWRRDDLDPFLVLGAVMAMMAGGALSWRPVTWLTGDAAHGKSTLQELIKYLLGGEAGLIQSADATKAGILSQVGYSSLPVSIDELEPSDTGSQRERDIITAARIAASGGQFLRGSADHKGHSGNVYSAFLFSSILIPPMRAQDMSRLIRLDLDRIPADAKKITLDPRKLRRIGAGLRRRLVEAWPGWAERLEAWRLALGRAGVSGRQADNYGTVLALADLAMNDELPAEDVLANWADKLAGALATDEDEGHSNAGDMLDHLLSQEIDVWRRGTKHTVAEWLAFAAQVPGAPRELGEATDHSQANRFLAKYGLRVTGMGESAALAIANKQMASLRALFEGSQWADGVWKQAAERVPGAQRGVNRTFARLASRCTEIPFTSLPGMLHFPADKPASRADQARPAAPPDDLDHIG